MKKLLFVIPAYNEEEVLEENISLLNNYLKKILKKYKWKILISDNNSQDKTLDISKKLAKKYKSVSYKHMEERPKSLSIKNIWMSEKADFYIYMDADLSTDIHHIPDLIKSLEEGYDIVTGSRVSEESDSKRHLFREIISRSLILLNKLMFSIDLDDFQCGFKGINKKVRDNLIPKMKCLAVGFMDTELLVVANSKNYKIKSIPVKWEDTRKSKSPIFKGITDALKNVFKIRFDLFFGKYD